MSIQKQVSGSLNIANALEADIATDQQIRGYFGREPFVIPKYTGTVSQVPGAKRVNDLGKGDAGQIDNGWRLPTFPELLVCSRLRNANWSAVWVLDGRVIADWSWRSHSPTVGQLPQPIEAKLNAIAETRMRMDAGMRSPWDGIPDVIAWRGNDLLMIECKRAKAEWLRLGQETWMHAAIAYGCAPTDLGVFEWQFARFGEP